MINLDDSDIKLMLERMTVEEIEQVRLFIQQLLTVQKSAAK